LIHREKVMKEENTDNVRCGTILKPKKNRLRQGQRRLKEEKFFSVTHIIEKKLSVRIFFNSNAVGRRNITNKAKSIVVNT